ncbi:MAG TPA: Crp/Fnr family transcriptional regulator [Dinghuibacter sp.]|uniref:Crp/Fnr family transcriptional regulator n=1 Tax=Dinghuibacter sp. TaxID=2024697 RepID=UPI002D0580E7|nr:Crp/Fnr family transcriptional regulator [Dinghuibacter sp.]HTJ11628.1 Crp/Fnr family transcriptional regulator [Dinghuibacter sp.]
MILDVLRKIHPLSDDLSDFITRKVHFEKIRKKHVLLRAGEVARYIYFIQKGLVRCYYINGGEEISSRFMQENHVVSPIWSFFQQVESYEYVVAVEDCELYGMSYLDLEECRKRFPEFNFIAFELMKRNYLKSEERLFIIRGRTAAERYRLLQERWPELSNRVAKKHIASYLDLTPWSLSRKDT